MKIIDKKLKNSYGPDLNRWAEIAIPAWTRILRESQEAGDTRREEYARKILELLECPAECELPKNEAKSSKYYQCPLESIKSFKCR